MKGIKYGNGRLEAVMTYTKDLEVMLGDPKRAVLVMTIPLIFSYAIAQINMFADTAWCAGLGSDSSTALATIVPFYWLIVGVGTGIGIGAAASIARHLGRGESEAAESIVLRADMDAVTGADGRPYHGCGHDGHVAVLLGAASVLGELPERPWTVRFIFQMIHRIRPR